MRAIDLYSGIGGWSLGLHLAQLKVVSSYERWQPAINTYQKNLKRKPNCVDIRALELSTLPQDIDVVVGSPPCTQFSYSNRGGSGDIQDGLVDIVKFLEVVNYLKPKFWVMENVPRVAKVIQQALADTTNEKFAALRQLFSGYGGDAQIRVYSLADFGVPQKRRRSFIGNIDFDLLESYSEKCPSITLGEVVDGLHTYKRAKDLVYGISRRRDLVTDNELESCLNAEEKRMNKDAKSFHPVYNKMAFPEPMDKPVRTVTATCTRVSRESIVIKSPEHPNRTRYRRLTIRERGLLQGFPISFQFFGTSYSQKLKMVGNALPPPMAYYIACSIRGVSPENLAHLNSSAIKPPRILAKAPKAPLESSGKTYPATRRFRAAIRTLRFGSGLRFELSNSVMGPKKVPYWAIQFYYGPSKAYKSVPLGHELITNLKTLTATTSLMDHIEASIGILNSEINNLSAIELQEVWTHRNKSHIGPYKIVDWLDALAEGVISRVEKSLSGNEREKVVDFILGEMDLSAKGNNSSKIKTHIVPIFVGFLIGSIANTQFAFTQKPDYVTRTKEPYLDKTDSNSTIKIDHKKKPAKTLSA